MEERKKQVDLTREEIYNSFFDELSSLLCSMFTYKNVDDTFNIYEFEHALLFDGHCGIGYNPNGEKDKLYALIGSPYGVGIYKTDFPDFVYANPVLKDMDYKNGENIIICRNTPSHMRMGNVVRLFAELLTDAYISLRVTTVNKRCPYVPVATTQEEKETFTKFFEQVREGKYAVVTSDNILSNMQMLPFENSQSNKIADIIISINNIYRMFFKRLGVDFSKDKNQAVLSDETENDITGTLRWVSAMLDSRKADIAKVNKLFNRNIDVSYSDTFIKLAKMYVSRETFPEENNTVAQAQQKEEVETESEETINDNK